MPFKSEKQKKWMYANKPEMAKKWEKKKKTEALRPADKKVLMVIGRDIINNIKKKNKNLKPSKQLGQALNAIFRAMNLPKDNANYKNYKKYFPKNYNEKLLQKLAKTYMSEPVNVQNTFMRKVMDYSLKESVNEAERDYKDEYKKFQSSTKSKKYRAELNKYNRQRGTYGNGDGKDASHKGGKIAGFESQSKNRGRAEKSRLKKEDIRQEIDEYLDGILDGIGEEHMVNEVVYQFKRYTNSQMDKLDALLSRAGYKGTPDFNKMTWTTKDKNAKIAKIIKSKGGKKIKESVKEAVSPRGWNMSKKFITILGKEVKNLVKYHRQQNEEDFLEVANYMELQLKYMKKNLNESIEEADLGLTYKKGKTVKVKHKTSGKSLVIIDKPVVRKEYEKIGFFAEGTCGYGIDGKMGEEPAGPHLIKKKKKKVDEGQKRFASKIVDKFDQAYLKFSREVRDVIKMMDRSTGSKTDGKIIDKAYSKGLIPLDKLMKSWDRGQQSNPKIDEKVIKVSKKDDVPGNAMKMSGEEKIKKLTYSGSNGKGSYEIKGKNLNVIGIRPRDKGFFVRHFTMKTGFRKANLYYDGVNFMDKNKKF